MNTLANYFYDLRGDRSMEDIAKRAGLDRSTVWKIENGVNIRPGTLRKIAIEGLMLKETSQEYANLVALWIVSRGLSDEPQPSIAKSLNRISKRISKQIEKNAILIAESIQPIRIEDQKSIIKALNNPDAMGAIIALARHYSD